jgi:hypothetical protein
MELIHVSMEQSQLITNLFNEGKIDEIIEDSDYSTLYDLILLRDESIKRKDTVTAEKFLIKVLEIVDHLVSLTPENW